MQSITYTQPMFIVGEEIPSWIALRYSTFPLANQLDRLLAIQFTILTASWNAASTPLTRITTTTSTIIELIFRLSLWRAPWRGRSLKKGIPAPTRSTELIVLHIARVISVTDIIGRVIHLHQDAACLRRDLEEAVLQIMAGRRRRGSFIVARPVDMYVVPQIGHR